MYILAGKVSNDLLKMYDEDSLASLFTDTKGNYYEYKFEVHLENNEGGFIRFSDSIGRMVPVDFDDLRDVAEMFARLSRFAVERKVTSESLLDELKNRRTWLEDELADITGE